MFHVSFHGVNLQGVTLDAKGEEQAVYQAVKQAGRQLRKQPTLTSRSPTGGECWFRISLRPDAGLPTSRPSSHVGPATGQAHVRVV